ncbi:MAG: nicotinate-nucleotide--dimethylbenzimidazole phosphoribosyltransferase [Clostridia bacterium]
MLNLIEKIMPTDKPAYDACIKRFDGIAKPIGALGAFEILLARIAAITASTEINIKKKCVLVFCADNGVVKQGVTQSDYTVTTTIAKMLANGTSSVCRMAKATNADVIPVDIGMIDSVDGLLPRKLMHGTNDFSIEPAMKRTQAIEGIKTGISMVEKYKTRGYSLIATGEAGIGNTTSAAAMSSALLNVSVEKVTGRGAGLSDSGLLRKQMIIKKALDINRPNSDDPIDVLTKVGGLDIAAMTGVFLGGAIYRVPVVMDGVISAVAALTAVRICPLVRDFILPSHESAEPAGVILINALEFSPVLHAGMRLGEGTGAVALFPLLDMAVAVYNSGATFLDLSMKAYTRNP